ncbi:ABC transporter permease [Pseudomonas sp. CFBP 13719]|nr:ABC transporter permease [Pseudomonas sp. CFBP 13719]
MIARRLAVGMVMLLATSLLIFIGLNLLPGDTATAILGQSATPAAVHALKLQLGLDQPAGWRYLHWLGGVLQGEFGSSLTSGENISVALSQRLNNTLSLAGITALVAVPLALLNAQRSSYVDTAVLKGLSPMRVLWRHVLPNAWGPIINVIVLNMAYLMVGVVIVENVFVYPGLGQYLVDSIGKRDVPVVQGCALVLAAIYILLNLFADVIALLTNPRLRHGK